MVFQISEVDKQYNGNVILEQVSLDIRGGEIHGVVGYNGAGKSTMAKIMAGLVQMDSGKIYLDHTEMKNWCIQKAIRSGIFYADCRSTLLPELSVTDNMLFGLNSVKGSHFFGIMRNQKRIERELAKAIREFGLECSEKSKVGDLSTSLKSVLELLRISLFHPKILLLDEVDSNVNKKYLCVMEKMINELKKSGTGILYISHQVDKVVNKSDRISVLMNAHIAETIHSKDTHKDSLFDMMFRIMEERPPKTIISPQAKLLDFQHISNSKLLDFSMEVREGEIVGVLGLDKEGPASIEEILFYNTHQGKTLYREKEIRILTPKDALNSSIIMLNTNEMDKYLFKGKSVLENMLPYTIRVQCRNKKRQREICKVYLDRLGIAADPESLIEHISVGYQKKVLLARCILSEGEVYIFNNPTDNIDVISKIDIYNIMNELKRRGSGIILVSNDYHEIAGISDVVVVVQHGKVIRRYQNYSLDEKIIFGFEE